MQVTAEALRAVLRGAGPTLRRLVLDGCGGLTGDTLVELGAACPQLNVR